MELLQHEQAYRGGEADGDQAAPRRGLWGAGGGGGPLAENLLRQGAAHLRVIDFDRVEARNLGTQVWETDDIGLPKVEALQHRLFRAAGREIDAVKKELTSFNVSRLLAGADLVLDGFDNHDSRALVAAHCAAAGLPCLHVGLHADYAEVIWNAAGDVCDYPLARNLVLVAVAVAAETLHTFLSTGARQSWTITLRDFAIRRYEYG